MSRQFLQVQPGGAGVLPKEAITPASGESLSFEFWFRALGTDEAAETLIEGGQLKVVQITGGGLLAVRWTHTTSGAPSNLDLASTSNLIDGYWHHIAVTYDLTSGVSIDGKLYVDGTPENAGSNNTDATSMALADDLQFAVSSSLPAGELCDYDEFWAWQGVLSQAEITAHYNGGAGKELADSDSASTALVGFHFDGSLDSDDAVSEHSITTTTPALFGLSDGGIPNTITFTRDSGETLCAAVYRLDDMKVWNNEASPAFEVFGTGSRDMTDYGIIAAEDNSDGVYSITIPRALTGREPHDLLIRVFKCTLDGSTITAVGDANGAFEWYWDGSEIDWNSRVSDTVFNSISGGRTIEVDSDGRVTSKWGGGSRLGGGTRSP